jgi:hypothetical protein
VASRRRRILARFRSIFIGDIDRLEEALVVCEAAHIEPAVGSSTSMKR